MDETPYDSDRLRQFEELLIRSWRRQLLEMAAQEGQDVAEAS